MATVVRLVALTVCAVVASAAWAAEAASRSRVGREHAVAVTGWGLLSATAWLSGLATGDLSNPLGLALLLLAVGCLAAAVGGAAPRATVAASQGPPAAEAALVAASVVLVVWTVVGSRDLPAWTVGGWVLLGALDLAVAAFVARVPVVVPTSGGAPVRRSVAVTGAAAAGLLAVADVATAVHDLHPQVPIEVAFAVRAAAYLLAAIAPWAPDLPLGRAVPTRRTVVLPYASVVVAAATLLVGALLGRGGPVTSVLAAVVVCGLVAVRGVARQDTEGLGRELVAAERRATALIENTSDVVLTVDAIGRVESANAAAPRLLHRTPEAMTGLDMGELAVPADRSVLRAAVDDVVHGRRGAHHIEIRLAPPATGSALLRMRAITGGAVVNLSDVTESVRLRERLDRLARFDEITGLVNRAHVLDRIAGWLRAGLPVAVLYGDLDGFKAVNDRFGHRYGDEVLAEAARRLRDAAERLPGEERLVARLGADEFVVALVHAREEELHGATRVVLGAMRPTFQVDDRAVRVGLSVGVATSWDVPPEPPPVVADDDLADTGPDEADALLHRADLAMIAAKQAGRFRAVRWDEEMQAKALRRVDIAIGLRRALDSGRLALAYQPLVRLSDGAVIGVEALLRVAPGDDAPGSLAGLPDLVSPAELVAVAEDTGEITEVGHWVLVEATRQAAQWHDLGHDVLMNVNVSVRQMAADGFVELVRQTLDDAGLPASALVVEITEGQLLSEADPAWGSVERLREMGVELVIDDFGTGYSSLAYLRRMPVRGVKLDRALLDDLPTDPRARTLARAVIAASRALGLLVVAEGLETMEAVRIARDLGAWAGQGFALYEALPPDVVTDVLAEPPTGLDGLDGRRGRRGAAARAATAAAGPRTGPTAGPSTGPTVGSSAGAPEGSSAGAPVGPTVGPGSSGVPVPATDAIRTPGGAPSD